MRLFSFATAFVLPQSDNEDERRREYILNALLLVAMVLFFAVSVISFAQYVTLPEYRGLYPIVFLCLLCFFASLYAASRAGYARIAAGVFVAAFFVLPTYAAYRWGVDVSASLLFFAIAIVITGMLINTRTALLSVLGIGVVMLTIGELQRQGSIVVDSYWRREYWIWQDTVLTVIMFGILAAVAWLSNREIERSLARARESEAALTEERDMLEVRVSERTRELRAAQLEQMSQAYRFIEFGRMASSVFHDLATPLTALSLNIESIARSQGTRDAETLAVLTHDVDRAQRATAHMEKLMRSMRRQLAQEGAREAFSLSRTLEDVVHVLTPYAREQRVRLCVVVPEEDIRTHNDPVGFTQVMTNLIANAIDAYADDARTSSTREVHITLTSAAGEASVAVKDHGPGVPEDALDKIFEPFVTTKEGRRGLGLGLSIARGIVEKQFAGTLRVTSSVGTGSTFTVHFPLRETQESSSE